MVPSSRPVYDWESQLKRSPFGFVKPWSHFQGMAGLFTVMRLLVVTLTYLFFDKILLSGH